MCKYCKLKTLNKEVGEKSNEVKLITRLVDGCQEFNVYLNRYIIEEDNINRAAMILDLDVRFDGNLFTLKEKQIDIKYCPFCGEEL